MLVLCADAIDCDDGANSVPSKRVRHVFSRVGPRFATWRRIASAADLRENIERSPVRLAASLENWRRVGFSRRKINAETACCDRSFGMKESVFSDERFLHLVVDASPAGMLIADEEGNIVRTNFQAESLFGYSREELTGKPVEMLIPQAHRGVHTSRRARYMAHPQPRPMAAGRDLFAQRKDGSQVAVDISLHPFQTKNGTYVLANILDATSRRQAARERESRQAIERLAMMGQLAGGVAHEIRTPLCVIRNDVYFLKRIADQLGEEGAECLEEIDRAVSKAERIVAELLDFTRDQPSRLAPCSLSAVIGSALEDVVVPQGIEMVLPPAGEDWWVQADHGQIERIVGNLLQNAIQALSETGRVEIRLGKKDTYAWIEVADNGPGIQPHEKERVFEPLYTTKPTGIGLGLAVSRRYAESNGGALIVTDNQNGGACFRLTLRHSRDMDA